MGRTLEGGLDGAGRRVAIAASRFNRLVTDLLLAGATEALRRHGVAAADVDVAWVPGAFELPLAAEKLAATSRYAGVVALGAVVRGATPHFEHVAGQAAAGLAAASRATGVPVAFGVLTCDTMEQALDRAGGKAGNKGAEAALTVLEMAGLLEAIDKEGFGEPQGGAPMVKEGFGEPHGGAPMVKEGFGEPHGGAPMVKD